MIIIFNTCHNSDNWTGNEWDLTTFSYVDINVLGERIHILKSTQKYY